MTKYQDLLNLIANQKQQIMANQDIKIEDLNEQMHLYFSKNDLNQETLQLQKKELTIRIKELIDLLEKSKYQIQQNLQNSNKNFDKHKKYLQFQS